MMQTQTATTPDRHQLAADVKSMARRLGFDLVGIADASPSAYRQYFRDWLESGQAGTMEYLHRRFDERTDPSTYLPGARSVICVAINYYVPLDPPPAGANHGRVARYALGEDYHEHLKDKLYELADWIRHTVPNARTRCGVDTAPIMEKELAARAGVGWLGKNTCLINPQLGSWLLLGEVITTLDLPADNPAPDHCGTCTCCIDACPTHAITAPYELDARKCISYLTIEHRGKIDSNQKSQISDWLYGCDICQDVCPHNAKVPITGNPALQPRFTGGTLAVDEVLEWDDAAYAAQLRRSAMRRVKLPVLQRNARIVANNLTGR
jgi:epoxyqueuosine reductase